MKQLVILSGKGGTGKTSVAAALAHLAQTGPAPLRAVLADADVDAANLELVVRPNRLESHDFVGGAVARIDPERCLGCGICQQVCRFDAIDGKQVYTVDPVACEGCAACVYQCPEGAICMEPQLAGQWYRSDSSLGPLFHADLHPGQENSGKLVTLVKQNARLCALDDNYPVIVVDGPPGIGCSVISATAGASLALIVTEPTAAGIHDLERILGTTSHFRIPAVVVINKADLYPQGIAQIEEVCQRLGIEVIGRIPFDPAVTDAMVHGEPVTAHHPQAPSSLEIRTIWQRLCHELG